MRASSVLTACAVYILCALQLSGVLGADPFKLAILSPFSGPNAFLGETVRQGVDLALSESFADINVTNVDTGCDPVKTVQAIRDLSKKGFIAAIGEACSGASLAGAAAIMNESIPFALISAVSTSPLLTFAGPNIFRTVPSDVFQGAKLAKIFGDGRRVAVLNTDEAYGNGLAKVVASTAKNSPVFSAALDSVADVTPDFIKYLLASNPQLVAIFSNQEDTSAAIVKGLASANYSGIVWGSEGLYSDTLLNATDGAADKLKLKVTTPNPGNADFVSKFSDYFGSEPSSPYSAYGFDAVNAITAALEMVKGTVTAPKLVTALKKVKVPGGATGTVRFDKNGDRVANSGLISCRTVQGNAFVPWSC